MANTLNLDLNLIASGITDDVEIALPQDFIKQTTNPWSPGNGPINKAASLFIRLVSTSNSQNRTLQNIATMTIAPPGAIREILVDSIDSTTGITIASPTAIKEMSVQSMTSNSTMVIEYPIKTISQQLASSTTLNTDNNDVNILEFKVDNATTGRTYQKNKVDNVLFPSSFPVLVDPGNVGSDTYEVILTTPYGNFLKPAGAYGTSYTITGSLANINTAFSDSSIKYAPAYNQILNFSMTMNVYKNTQLYRTYTFGLSQVGEVTTFGEVGLYGQSVPTSEDTINLSESAILRAKLGYTSMDLLVVGGGGAGGSSTFLNNDNVNGGGGGAGTVIVANNQSIGNFITPGGYNALKLVTGPAGGFNDEGSPTEKTGGGASYILGSTDNGSNWNTTTPLVLAIGGGDGGDASTIGSAGNNGGNGGGGGGGRTAGGNKGSGGLVPVAPNENSVYSISYTASIVPGTITASYTGGVDGGYGNASATGLVNGGNGGGSSGGVTNSITGVSIDYARPGISGNSGSGTPSPGSGGFSEYLISPTYSLGKPGATYLRIKKN